METTGISLFLYKDFFQQKGTWLYEETVKLIAEGNEAEK